MLGREKEMLTERKREREIQKVMDRGGEKDAEVEKSQKKKRY